MLRFLAFLLGLILGFNGAGAAPEAPDPGQSSPGGQKPVRVVAAEGPAGGPAGGIGELRFPSFEVEQGGGLLHKA